MEWIRQRGKKRREKLTVEMEAVGQSVESGVDETGGAGYIGRATDVCECFGAAFPADKWDSS